jgi:hypothetical protein
MNRRVYTQVVRGDAAAHFKCSNDVRELRAKSEK